MINRFFNETAEIYRKVTTPDGMGSSSIEWIAIMTSQGRLDQASANEVNRASKLMYETTHTWFCGLLEITIVDPVEQATYFGTPFAPSPFGEGIPSLIINSDRLVVNGETYEITAIDNPMNMNHHLEISVKRLESGQL